MRPSPSKYGAQPTVVDGIRFHSKAEARRWQELKLLEKAGKIRDLKRQVSYGLHAAGELLVGTYRADFEYWCVEPLGTHKVTEDVKGYATELAKWKLRHFEAQYGRAVVLIRQRAR